MKKSIREELDKLVEKYENGEIDFKELLHQITWREPTGDNSLWEYVDSRDAYFAGYMQYYIDEWSREDFDYALGGSALFENCAFIENEQFMKVVMSKFPSIATWTNNPEVCDEFLQKFVEPELERLKAKVAKLEKELEEQKKGHQEEVEPVYTPVEASAEHEAIEDVLQAILDEFSKGTDEPTIDE